MPQPDNQLERALNLTDSTSLVIGKVIGTGVFLKAAVMMQYVHTPSLMLAAWAHSVGSCIASIYPDANKRKARELLGVPEGKWLHTAISLGYPADERALRLSAERGSLSEVPIGRQDFSQFVSWERFAVP